MGQPRWTTTSDQYLDPTAGDAWAAEAAASGQRGSQRILGAGIESALSPICDYFGVTSGTHIVARRRLILADDEPVELAESYWLAELAGLTRLAEPAKIPGGTARFLAELGYTPSEVREDITVSRAREPLTASGQAKLGIGPDDPVMILTRTLLDHTGKPYQVDVNTMRAGRHIRYVRQAG